MPIRPEDHGGTTDPLAPLANTSTMPGRGAGKAIDPSKPSLEQPTSSADRIAELEQRLAILDGDASMGDFLLSPEENRERIAIRAELSRLRNSELNSRGDPMDAATIARGRKPTDAENTPLRNEQPKGGITQDLELPIRSTVAKAGPAVDARYNGSHSQEEEHRRQVAEGLRTPSPATSPGPQDVKIDVRVKIDNIVGTAIDAALSDCDPRPISAGQYSGCIQSVTDALLSAFPAIAQSDAQPVGWQEAWLEAAQWHRRKAETFEGLAKTESGQEKYYTALAKEHHVCAGHMEAEVHRVPPSHDAPTPPARPEGAREALEKAIRRLEDYIDWLYRNGPDGGRAEARVTEANEAITGLRNLATPSSAGLIEAAEWPDHTLGKLDVEALKRQQKRLDDMAEGWIEEARQYSVEGDKNGDRMMMRLAHIFDKASNGITAVLRHAAARARPSEKDK